MLQGSSWWNKQGLDLDAGIACPTASFRRACPTQTGTKPSGFYLVSTASALRQGRSYVGVKAGA
ncbi:hypothetical protein KJ656_04450 [bacterium]|nr:hypothetical protein [bacterium]